MGAVAKTNPRRLIAFSVGPLDPRLLSNFRGAANVPYVPTPDSTAKIGTHTGCFTAIHRWTDPPFNHAHARTGNTFNHPLERGIEKLARLLWVAVLTAPSTEISEPSRAYARPQGTLLFYS